MTDLFAVSIDAVDGCTLRGRVLLVDAWWLLDEGYHALLGKKIRVSEDGCLLADDGKTVLTPRRTAKAVYGEQLTGGGGQDQISRYVMTERNPEEFYRRTAEIADLEGAADLSDWRTWVFAGTRPFEESLYADFTATVRDPAYLEHMVGGMRWSTAHTGRV
ncbi:hypothetical protein ACH4U7_18845 [Streptomyces sp. NPDC020845]|uniref:hypothetical protein n=1 Tax=Streptomyces sp. NPDC020845 TaxID=3365096 RepID=UPI00378A6D85